MHASHLLEEEVKAISNKLLIDLENEHNENIKQFQSHKSKILTQLNIQYNDMQSSIQKLLAFCNQKNEDINNSYGQLILKHEYDKTKIELEIIYPYENCIPVRVCPRCFVLCIM